MKDRQLSALESLLAATEETNRHLVAVRKLLSEMDPDPMGKTAEAADAVRQYIEGHDIVEVTSKGKHSSWQFVKKSGRGEESGREQPEPERASPAGTIMTKNGPVDLG